MKVTVFKKANIPSGGISTDIETVLESMKTGGKLKEIVLDIANTEDKKERSRKKLDNLPVICFNGEFSYRNMESFIRHNGFIILDIDGLDDAKERKVEISKLPYVYSCFISPSYKGIKFIVKIPEIDVESLGSLESDYIFKEYFQALCEDIEGIDKSGKDTSRACFFSYDPEIYINKEAEVYTKRVDVKRPENYIEEIDVPDIEKSQQWALDIIGKKVNESSSGSRHVELYAASRLAGGYVSGGIIDMYEAEAVLQSAFSSRAFDERYDYKKTIRDGMKNGLHYPVYEDPKYDKVNKKTEAPYEIHPQLIDEPIQSGGVKTAADLMYVPFEDFEDEADEMYIKGNPKGLDCRHPKARDFISYKEGFTTFVYAAPFSGKTQWTISELVFLAERYGNKVAVYSKEIGEPKDVLAEVASTYIGSLFSHGDEDLKMTVEQKNKAKRFFKEHFYVIDPMYKKQTIDVTVEAIFHCIADIERKFDIKINNAYIDPLSEVDDAGEDRIDRFTKKANKLVNDDARINGRHNFLVSHIRDQQPIVDKDSGTTWFPVPTAREISGGQNSFKQGYQMVCVYRPSPHLMDKETQTEYLSNETHVYIQKSKPKGVGKAGMYKLYYDWKTNRYYETPDMRDYPSVEQDKLKDQVEKGERSQLEVFNPSTLTPPTDPNIAFEDKPF